MIQHYKSETDLIFWIGKRGDLCWEFWPFLKCDLGSEAEPGASGEEGIAAVMEGTGELVCEQAFYAQMIVVARYTFYH